MTQRKKEEQENAQTERIISRGVQRVIVPEVLRAKLASGKKLRIKFGIDPTAPHIHLGHLVILRKLRQFQEAGHHIILIVGDFTAKIGDPTDKATARKPLHDAEIEANMK